MTDRRPRGRGFHLIVADSWTDLAFSLVPIREVTEWFIQLSILAGLGILLFSVKARRRRGSRLAFPD
jgi:hypothetical protein